MKKTVLAFAILASTVGIAQAHSYNDGFESFSELRGSLGQFNVDSDVKSVSGDIVDSANGRTAPSGAVVLRHHYSERIASEVEFTIAGDAEMFGRDSVNINTAAFLSVVVKADKYAGFLPYAKVGYGLLDLTLSYDGEYGEDRSHTYVAGVGVDYDMTETTFVGLQYEYFGDFNVDYSADGFRQTLDLTRASLNVGFRF